MEDWLLDGTYIVLKRNLEIYHSHWKKINLSNFWNSSTFNVSPFIRLFIYSFFIYNKRNIGGAP